MFFVRVKTPRIAHVTYLIGNKGEGTVVDPRRDVEDYLRLARKHKLTRDPSLGRLRDGLGRAGSPVTNGRHKAFGHGDIRLDDDEALRRAVRTQEAYE